jgi:hypothetical protein
MNRKAYGRNDAMNIYKKNQKSNNFSLVNVPYLKKSINLLEYENAFQILVDRDEKKKKYRATPKRGIIRNFSQASRNRLLRLFSCLQYSKFYNTYFVTLTYHNRNEPKRATCKSDLNVFLQYIRDNYPLSHYIWRLELQKRGMPHFHVILFNMPQTDLKAEDKLRHELNIAWHRIADPTSSSHFSYGFDIKRLISFKQAFFYISKYCAKIDNNLDCKKLGRIWSRSVDLPVGPTCIVTLSTTEYYFIRRICRKIIEKRKGKKSRFAKHLKKDESFFFFGKPRTTISMDEFLQSPYIKPLTDYLLIIKNGDSESIGINYMLR